MIKPSAVRVAVAFTALTLYSIPSFAQNVITTIAGNGRLFHDDGRRALEAQLGRLSGLTTDKSGNLYVSDQVNSLVYKVSTAGVITVVAGNNLIGFSGDGGPATSASLNNPIGLALDNAGNLYIGDQLNYRVRKVTPDGIISSVAGTGISRFSGDNGPATAAGLLAASDVAFDSAGSLYIMDNRRVRKVDTSGIISTVAGNGNNGFSGDGGPATAASLSFGTGLDVDSAGNIYIVERDGNRIRKVSGGIITTVAGNGQGDVTPAGVGDGGPATSAVLPGPQDVAVASDGTLFVTSNNAVRKISPSGIISTVGVGGGGPFGLALLGSDLYVNQGVGRVVKVDPKGTITFVAGTGPTNFSGDGGPAVNAGLSSPYDVVADPTGALYIADLLNFRIRRVTPGGIIETIAGTGVSGGAGPIPEGVAATSSRIQPYGVALDRAGNLYVADGGDYRVRMISPDGNITTVAGAGTRGFSGDGGSALNAELSLLHGVALDSAGVLYIADTQNHRIRKVGPDGVISTIAGNGIAASSGDGGLATSASLNNPTGVAVDPGGSIFIAEFGGGNRIRKITPDGIISTFAGGGTLAPADGLLATKISFGSPHRVRPDASGNVFAVGVDARRAIKVSPAGIVTVVAGAGINGFDGDGGPATAALLGQPRGIDVDAAGNVYIVDSASERVRKVLAKAPSFAVSPATLAFSAPAGGEDPVSQRIAVTSEVAGLSFTATVSTQRGGNWLSVLPQAGKAPGFINVSVILGVLAPGAYQGSVTVTAPNSSTPPQTVSVVLTVADSQLPRLDVSSPPLSFSLNRDAVAASQLITVRNGGAGSLDFTAIASSTGGNWLSVSPARGTAAAGAPATVIITANPVGLQQGTYTGRVEFRRPGTSQIVTVPVTLAVSNIRQSILLSQTGLTFTAVVGGGTPPPQSFGILNTRQGTMAWTVSVTTLNGGGWLSATPTSGSSDANSLKVPLVDVAVDASGLTAGDYYGQVSVSVPPPGADNSPQVVFVVLRVLPTGSNPGPIVRPTGLIFTSRANGSPPGSQTVSVSNITDKPISFRSGRVTFDGLDWFVTVPPTETVSPGQPVRLTVQTDTTILTPGIRRGALTLLFSDGTIQPLNLLSVVLPATGGGRNAEGDCVAKSLLPVFISSGTGFSAQAGWPTAVEVKVVDDCGTPMVTGAVTAAFSNGDPPVSLARLGDGQWSGTWQPRGQTGSGVTVTVTAQIPELNISGSVQITGSVQVNSQVPVIAQAAIVNAASNGPPAVAAPGSLITIYGSKLADRTALAPSLPLQTELAGTSVVLGGQPLLMSFVSDRQVNAIVPFEVQANVTHQVLVQRGKAYSVPEPVTVSPTEPAIFSTNSSGSGQGHIYTTGLVDAKNAATAGDIVVVYATGLGEVDPPVRAGTAAPLSPLSNTKVPVQALVGGRAAEVIFAGLAPLFTGVYQVNVKIPAGVAPGSEVSFVLTQNGAVSNPVTLALR